ncbi:MAG: methyltransferase [Pseudomonadales bacterium]|nr:methyltransferase [Pseudomonadales bacterium]MBO6596614.1 methyltransferase [Pseudomonadales bacterium]MBO6823397.1 methyltransferase [Pseudomonadales bacterium]
MPNIEDELIQEIVLEGCKLRLYTSPSLFLPNATSRLFTKAIRIESGDIVFDIGSGVGPIAIWAAKKESAHVYAVEVVDRQCDLLRRNAELNEVSHKIEVLNSSLFNSIPDNVKADVLVADLSGIAERPGRLLGWYPPAVPTGGEDGAEVIVDLLNQAGSYLSARGRLYFPIASGLSNEDRIIQAAEKNFGRIEQKVDVNFPISRDKGNELLSCADSFIHLTRRSKTSEARAFSWRGLIFEASLPVNAN